MFTMAERNRPSGLTAAQVSKLLDQARAEGKADISMSTFYRLARDGVIEKTNIENRVQDALYNEEQVRDLIEYGTPAKRKRKSKIQQPATDEKPITKKLLREQQQSATDWIQQSDLPYVYVMDTELYGVENSVSPTSTWAWWRKNPHACRILFNKENRKDIWGALSIIPMEEDTIYKLLSGELSEQDITADQVLAYEPGNIYNCYVASIAIRSEHRQSFSQLLHSVLNFWCEQYPEIQISSLYGFALNEEEGTGLRLIRKLYFAPRYDIGNNAWELRLDRYSPSPVIQQFQECLAQKLQLHKQSIHLPPIENRSFTDVPATISEQSPMAVAKYQLAREEDLPAFVSIDEAIFGPSGVSFDEYTAMHRMWWEQNHEIFHILRLQERIVGYVSTVPLPLEKIIAILKGEARPRDIRPEEIGHFELDEPLNIYIAVLGVDNGFSTRQKRLLAGKLITGLKETFTQWGERGVDIHAVYARSRFDEAQRILKHVGFQEMEEITSINGMKHYYLNLEMLIDPFRDDTYENFAKEYRQGLERYKQGTQG